MSRMARIEAIDRSPWADIFPHDHDDIARLAEDIKARGVLTPLHVVAKGERFELLTGHDRLEAAKLAGLVEVPVERREVPGEDERFAYFLKDNVLRKSVDKRAVAKAAWLRYPKRTVNEIAGIAGVSMGTAFNGRIDAVAEQPDVFKVENVGETRVDTLGREQPVHKAPRIPKLPDPKSAKPLALIPREQHEPATTAPEPEPEVAPEPVTETVEQAAASEIRAVNRTAWGRVSGYAASLPIVPRLTDAEIAEAVSDTAFTPAFRKQIETALDFCERVLLACIEKERTDAAA